MGRYTLKINEQPIKNFKGINLDSIDKFTINYSSISDVLKALELNDIKGVKNLKITYNSNHQEKKLNVALDDKKDLKYIIEGPNSKISYTNVVFKRYANTFCEKARKDARFYEFIMKSRLLNNKIKQYLELNFENPKVYYEDKIKEHLGSYLEFRNILFLFEEYDIFCLQKEAHEVEKIQIDDIDDSNKDDEYFDEEEKAEYQKYMDNLPDDMIPDYMDSNYRR